MSSLQPSTRASQGLPSRLQAVLCLLAPCIPTAQRCTQPLHGSLGLLSPSRFSQKVCTCTHFPEGSVCSSPLPKDPQLPPWKDAMLGSSLAASSTELQYVPLYTEKNWPAFQVQTWQRRTHSQPINPQGEGAASDSDRKIAEACVLSQQGEYAADVAADAGKGASKAEPATQGRCSLGPTLPINTFKICHTMPLGVNPHMLRGVFWHCVGDFLHLVLLQAKACQYRRWKSAQSLRAA